MTNNSIHNNVNPGSTSALAEAGEEEASLSGRCGATVGHRKETQERAARTKPTDGEDGNGRARGQCQCFRNYVSAKVVQLDAVDGVDAE